MTGLELVVVVGLAVLVSSVAAQKLHVPAPVPLLLIGIGLAAINRFRDTELSPEVVLFLFLPALLFWEALTSSVQSLRKYLRPILLTSTLLVVLTAGAVAWVAHSFGVPWTSAWVLGAAVAPTDATVVASMGSLLPQRTMTVLRSESLLNDGTALVLYSVAIGVATQTQTDLTAGWVAERFAVSVFGGVAAGLLVGWLVMLVRRRLENSLHDNAVQILAPFVAYLLAEQIDASGVLAVVAAGLYMMRTAPLTIGARSRNQSTGFWSVTAFLLNGSLFVLVGLRLPHTVVDMTSLRPLRAVMLALALVATLFVVRLLFLTISDGLVHLVAGRFRRRARTESEQIADSTDAEESEKPTPEDTRVAQHSHRLEMAKARLISSLAGFRGGVSLAMALSVPTLVDGKAFPARDVVVFCTSFAVLGTIVVQGLLLPVVVRWARLPGDDTMVTEFHDAEQQAITEALEALPELAHEHGVDDDDQQRLRVSLEAQRDVAGALLEGDDEHEAVSAADSLTALREALIGVRRETIVRLRDEGQLDDEVLLALQRKLDREELRWSNDVVPEAD